MTDQPIPADRLAELDNIRERTAAIRSAVKDSPMGRHLAAQERERDNQATAYLWAALTLIVRGDDDLAKGKLESLAAHDPDLVDALGVAGRTLGVLADEATKGMR